MTQKVNKSGALMQEVRDITDYWAGMKAEGKLDSEDDALIVEEDLAKEILYAIHCWLAERYGKIDDETMKEFVNVLLDKRL
ncbi:hypothetical protein [Negativicoccus succinicivorans]